MEGSGISNFIPILTMVIVGAVSGSLAARVMRGDNFGFVVNSILGIAGAVVGNFLFDKLGMTPGENIVRIVSETFDVALPKNLVGMIFSGTIGAIIILFLAQILRGGRRRARR